MDRIRNDSDRIIRRAGRLPFRESGRVVSLLALLTVSVVNACAAGPEDGYELWMRYRPLADDASRSLYSSRLRTVTLATPTGADSPTLAAARQELADGLKGILDLEPRILLVRSETNESLGSDGFTISPDLDEGIRIAANSGTGVLYGAFALLRRIQTGRNPDETVTSVPRIQRRLLNHWDNLNRFVERGYAGSSLWEWFHLPGIRSARYRDYARACASIGLNGTVLTNVNADALILTPQYMERVAALADEFRPYGIRVYLTARFSAPIQIGGLPTADPFDPDVRAWWQSKINAIYAHVPDFGGFLVKANSEGQPGPQEYGRTQADGANMLAEALAPHEGIVIWRAFVYQADNKEDRVKQASSEFDPLDGKFHANVVVQIKNGPLDFMPREPFHPLFGSLKDTNLAPEFQITQEYLGGSVHLAYLGPMWKEVLEADTFAAGPGSTVARVADGSLRKRPLSAMAGVANTGTDRNWTGHPLAQANWYAFGRLAWDHTLTAEAIAEEWTRMTFSNDEAVVRPMVDLLMGSRETVVNFSMPLGLHHIMAEGHHYGPGPWVTHERADWSAPYYHQADEIGLGADRTVTGSNALEDYAPELQKLWGDQARCPENLLLWFHHVPWDHPMKSGRTLWDELCLRYQQGVDEVRAMQASWNQLKGRIDDRRHTDVSERLIRQESDAREWRDACLLYFQQFSRRPLPAGVEPPEHDLEFYRSARLRYVPGHPGDQ
ncbi:MAG: alpha-glucuronidase family glycosyl hydrolase [Opitutaceae bacterium]